MVLTFVGLGLWEESDISMKGIEAVMKADKIYAEFYTSKMSCDVVDLEKFFKKEINILSRSDLEEGSRKIVEEARERDVVILVPGDPMVATTHSAIVLEAIKMGVEVGIIHNASIVSAVCGLTGLHNYRFGKSATVSWHPSRVPVDVIFQNRSIDAHSLLFLDLHPPMSIEEAIGRLVEIDDEIADLYAVGIARAGSREATVRCDRAEKLRKFDFGDTPHTLIFLAKTLHFMEYECLKVLANAPEELEKAVR